MASITAAMIKEVRERTGVGMTKCKDALNEANGDVENAISVLRKSGMASAVKKQGRQTKEGMIGTASSSKGIAVVEVNSETDFVVQNDLFREFLTNVTQEVADTMPGTLEDFLAQKYSKEAELTIDEYRGTMVQTIGENIRIKRLKTFTKDDSQSIGVYSHLNGKIVVVVEVEGSADEADLARDIAMHIAAASPEYLAPEFIPSEKVDHEREIARSQMAGKPENIIDKIIDGKLKAFYDSVCLMNQAFIKDDSLTVAEVVSRRAKEAGKDLAVTGFVRWAVGEDV